LKESERQNDNAPAVDIRISRLNNDQTRRVDGSEHLYNVYFELTAIPPRSWERLFEGEWRLLNMAHPDLWQAVRVDRNFLVMCCPLDQVIPLHLPFLKKAVAATNLMYKQYEAVIAKERAEQALVWERRRSEVQATAKAIQLQMTTTIQNG